MNPSHKLKVDKNVILAAARVQAALELVPHIVGPKDVWAIWMRDNLEAEMVHLPKAGVSSPHPRLLGSLDAMLLRHYTGGMSIKTLFFEEVRADDPSIRGPEYVDVPEDALPDLKGADAWWNSPPPSVNLRISPTSKVKKGSSNQPSSSGNNAKASTILSNAGNVRMVRDTTRKRRVTRQDDKAPPAKKKKKAKSREFIESDKEDEVGFSLKGKAKADDPVGPEDPEDPEDPEAPKICDSCKSRGVKCMWPMKSEASGVVNEKRACDPCASAKIRCIIVGKFSIRPPRGKMAAPRNRLQQDNDGLSDRLGSLEQKSAEEKQQLASRITNLELEVKQLKEVVASKL